MLISKIVDLVNHKLAGEILRYEDIEPLLDSVIDDINTQHNTKFPVFSELPQGATEYTAIPDKYIRSVIAPGAAFKFFCIDEEGADVAPKFEYEYNANLFYMVRDYLPNVPLEYQETFDQGFIDLTENHLLASGGVEVNGYIFDL